MKVSIHAGQRFLERVMSKREYSCFDINMAIEYLEKLLKDVVPTGKSTQFALPCFENFKVVYADGCVLTILPKGNNHVR
jgi:hypothetical protein